MFSASVLVILVLSGAYWAYQNIQQVRQTITANLETQRSLNETARQVRLQMLESTILIEAYLLDPAIKTNREQALASIDRAISLTERMGQYPASILGAEQKNIEQLKQDLTQLVETSRHLFTVRDDANQQFPSLAVGNDIMQPNRDALNNALALAFNELHEEQALTKKPDIYQEFVETRYLWSHMLSNFRLYLANRVGSFNEAALPNQEAAIDTMYKELKQRVAGLGRLEQQGKLGFQSSIAVQDIKTALQNWYVGFQQVKEIHHADNWRMDSKIMKEGIVPLLDRMSDLLFDIENRINQATAEDVDILSSATRRQTTILLWGTAGLLLLMLLIFWSTNRLVFKPLAMVVKALKAEASGIESVLLPEVHSQETAALVDSFTDMAKQVRKRQEDLEHQALHDALTGLPNRTLLQERITHDIQMARRDRSHVSLLILDLDRFKEINDTLGHHIGDILLVEVGRRLSSMIRTVDTIARLGGDEFAIALTNTDEEGAINVANKLIHAMEQTVDVDELKLYISMSIGIATYPQHGDDSLTLVQHADVAMYNAKRQQTGCCIYDSSEDSYSLMRLEMINDLRDAIESNQVELYFQPIIDLQNDIPCGLECLLRWKHSRYGYLPPEQVIELAEHTGLINALTYWVLEKVLSKYEKLHDSGHEVSISINISVNNLKDPQFIEKVSEILQSSSMGDKSIIFEITESAMMLNPLRGAELLSQLDKMGVRVSIDDFGTGYSSLAYLKQLPVDELKIDRSFIAGMSQHNSDETIVRSTIELAHNLGLKVVAEGVENEDVRQQLKDWGCDKVQGFLYTRPVNLDALLVWLDRYQSDKHK